MDFREKDRDARFASILGIVIVRLRGGAGSFKCFVVDGKAKCLPKQRMLANEKQEAKVKRLDPFAHDKRRSPSQQRGSLRCWNEPKKIAGEQTNFSEQVVLTLLS